MKNRQLPLILFSAGIAFATVSTTRASLVIYYSFEGNAPGVIADNTAVVNGAGGANGTFDTGNNGGNISAIVTSGVPFGFGGSRALLLIPANDGLGSLDAASINTNFSAVAAGITPGTAYTAMAWVNFANSNGDNMIFGGTGNPVLHNGTRNGMLHSGHWGDDIGPDQGVNVSSNPGFWHHVAYTNDVAGNQSVYWDGNLVVGPGATGTAGGMDINKLLHIGTSDNGGSFNGMIDEIKVYNELLTQTQIQQLVPEPGSAALAGLIGLGVLRMRRRAAR